MHQGGGLKRLAGSLLCHLSRCQMPQFIINQFKQFVSGLGIAFLNRSQQNSSLAHGFLKKLAARGKFNRSSPLY